LLALFVSAPGGANERSRFLVVSILFNNRVVGSQQGIFKS